MSPELVLQFLAWNAEATARCETLSPAGAAPGNVRSLFHSSTVQRACPGCLLEQVCAAPQCQPHADMQELRHRNGPANSCALCLHRSCKRLLCMQVILHLLRSHISRCV